MEDQIINALVEPFPAEAIKTRRGGRGKELRYLETWRVVDRLNRAFAHHWTFRLLEWKVMENEVVVHAELEAAGIAKQASKRVPSRLLSGHQRAGTVVDTVQLLLRR